MKHRPAKFTFAAYRHYFERTASLRCPKCQRTDCGLLATVIIGEREWFESVAECMDWQARLAALPKGRALAVMGHEQYYTLKERGIA